MLSSIALLSFLQDGPVALAVLNDEGVITLVSRAFEKATGLGAGGPAPEWLLTAESTEGNVRLGKSHYSIWKQRFAQGILVMLNDRTELHRLDRQLARKQCHLVALASSREVYKRALDLEGAHVRKIEERLSAVESQSQEELRQQQVRSMLMRHLSEDLATSIAASPSSDLRTHKSILTTVFADLPAADEIFSDMESEEIVDFLREYRSTMSRITFEHGGAIDKIMAVRIKIFFGDPVLHEDHAMRAVGCGLQMREAIRRLRNQWFPTTDGVDLQIGIHTGYATVGTVEAGPWVDYTAVGKNVALAGALQREAKPGQILVSRRTFEIVKGAYLGERLQITTSGSSRPVTVYNITSEKSTKEVDKRLLHTTEVVETPSGKLEGRKLGPYQVVELVGSGGMGTVYKGFDAGLNRHVALKILSAALATDSKFVARFKREARALASINSPSIAQIYFISDQEVPPFFAMEFIAGRTLRDTIAEAGPMPLRRGLKLLSQIARGLQVAQESGVIHRDVKPDNIMITDAGQAKLTDFGLVKRADEESGMTAHGMVLGTPLYMSPEQARGEAVDLRSDIYSLGATFFHMLTGDPPYMGESAIAIMRKHEEAPLPPLSSLPRTVSPAVYDVLVGMMAKRREDRFQDYDSILEAVEGC